MLVNVLHATKPPNGQPGAFDLQLLLAHLVALTGLQTFGGVFVRHSHAAVTRNVILRGLVEWRLRCYL